MEAKVQEGISSFQGGRDTPEIEMRATLPGTLTVTTSNFTSIFAEKLENKPKLPEGGRSPLLYIGAIVPT